MGRTLYAYADKLWEADQTFTFTGEPRQFTLQPGEYLFICNGAAGGGTNASSWWGYGASAYGVFETNQEETLYAVVGGNGEAYNGTGSPHPGGYNGGGDGGTGNNGTGGSGGGASDIRLTLDETEVPPVYENNLPEGYQELAAIQLRFTNNGYINTGYLPRANSRYEMDAWFHAWSSEKNGGWRIPFGTRTGIDARDSMGFAVRYDQDMRLRINVYNQWPYGPNNDIMIYNRDVHITYNDENHKVIWTDGEKTCSITLPYEPADCPQPLYLFTMNNWGSPGDYYCRGMRLYRFKIYESDVLVHDYIPAKRISDNKAGLYDIIADTFIAYSGDAMLAIPKETNTRTLLSRILVAAGGGGDAKFSANQEGVGCGCVKMAYGGGTRGSCVSSRMSGFYDTTEWNWPDQSTIPCDLRCKFGKGMDAPNRTQYVAYSAEGGGGGGGGWYGGYAAANITAQYTSVGGGGGSSYALTADSYKPYGYIPTSHYYFKQSSLVPCQSTEGSILICRKTRTIAPEDTIIVPLTGQETKIGLFPGTYNLKCWGGEGGFSPENESRYHGGYSEGTLHLSNKYDIYGYVGGAGLWHEIRPYERREDTYYNDQCGFNGGGMGTRYQNLYVNAYCVFAGGGATDLRLTNDETPVHEPIPDPETRDDIPSTYTQLKALVSTTYFNPGYIRKANSEFFIDMKTRDNLSGYEILFGDSNNGAPQTYLFYPNPPSRSYVAHWQLGVTEANGSKKMPSQTRVKIQTTSHSLTWTSPNDSETLAIPEGTFTGPANAPIYFGNGHNGTSSGSVWGDGYVPGTWYAIKISESGVMVHDFVPCKRNSDDAFGWYDVVTDTFYQWGSSYVNLDTITYPSKTLLSRFIVAGGAGGRGYSSGLPGKGGGTSGGSPQNGNGTNMGPGTQLASPQSADYPDINGGFGYGGNGVVVNGGRGGAGGGGWFGGSGTYPDGSSDNDKGGSGGSGYVLTEDSYKPEYYIPDEEFYLTNASTTLGGNTLPPNITKIEIDVIEAYCNKLVLHDAAGYKSYDESESKWVVFSDSITPELIDEYGRFDIPNLDGVLKRFEVIMDDPDDVLTGIEVSYVPLPQSIVFLVPRRYKIGRTIIDAVYDTSIYDFQTNVTKYSDEYNAYKITVDKIQDSESLLKLYSIMLLSQ